MALDFTTDHGKMALEQLQNDIVIWLTTVTLKGMPQPNPIWFIWEDDCVVTWVQPNSARIRNFEHNNQVSLNLVGDPAAHHMTVLNGIAEIDESIGSSLDNDQYMKKYGHRWAGMDMTPESAAEEFSLPLRIRPTNLRGF